MSELIKLTDKQLDALREVGSIGSGHAAIALSQLLGEKISIGILKVEVIPSDEFNRLVGGPEVLVSSVHTQLFGDMQGGLLLIFPRQDAINLADILLHKKKGSSKTITEMGQSALREVGNILTGSYLSAMSHLVPFKMALSVPKFGFDMVQMLIDEIFDEIMQSEKRCISLVTEFIESVNQIKGYYIFLPRRMTLERIIDGLAV